MTDCIPAVNQTMELADCRALWRLDEAHACWCLEDVLYTDRAQTPMFQRLSIFVPRAYMSAPGILAQSGSLCGYTAATAPIIFANNAAGYMQMPQTRLDGPRDSGARYLHRGMVYVTCGCRGRESRNQQGLLVGKSPATLIDLKTAIRFLRHNRAALPGCMARIVSVGWSAGGAMSSLLGVTGDHADYEIMLRENGAFMDESDAVYAAQIYCPIIDLEHADLAYEWMFRADKTCEASHAGPAETMSPFQEALSRQLTKRYAAYVNRFKLIHPQSGETLTLTEDGRNGTFYTYFMDRLSDAATDYLMRLESISAKDYLSGAYHPDAAGANLPMNDHWATDKRNWLSWDGKRASIRDLDAYVLNHRRRMKPCTSFDTLAMRSGENQVFGCQQADYMHFNAEIAKAMEPLRETYPEEYARYHDAYAAAAGDKALAKRVYLLNPLNFIGTNEESRQAAHYRIRVGADDADTSLSIAMVLALRLAHAAVGTVDYALLWDQPHSEADYPGEFLSWIDRICKNVACDDEGKA